jgi:hypothetical protein
MGAKPTLGKVSTSVYTDGAGVTCRPGERGRVTFVQGRAYIQRSNRIIPAIVGEGLLSGDKISADEGSSVTIDLDEVGSMQISEKTRFNIPCDPVMEESVGGPLEPVITFFKGIHEESMKIWDQIKEFLSGESFEPKTPTATAGVRG